MSGCMKCSQYLPCSAKHAPQRRLVGVEGSHGHDAAKAEVLEPAEPICLSGCIRRRVAALRLFPDHVHLHEHVECPLACITQPVDCVSKFRPVDGVKQVKAREVLDLVAL